VLAGCFVEGKSAKTLPTLVLGVATVALPISLFALTPLPKDLSPCYSTRSLVGFSVLAAYAVWVVKSLVSSRKPIGALMNYGLIAVTIAYACAAAWTINREFRTGNYPTLTQEKLSSLAFKQLDQVINHGGLSRFADKTIVFDNLTSRMYWAMGYGRMLDVMFPEHGISYYFLDSEEVKGNLSPDDPLLQQENTLVLKQVNEFLFDKWNPPVYQYGTPLTFGWSGNYIEYEGSGWSDHEREFTWTDGKSANLLVPSASAGSDIQLKARLHPLLIPGKVDRQRVIVRVNGEQVAEWIMKDEPTERRGLSERLRRARVFQERTAVIPSRLLGDSHVTITFELPDAVRPADLGVSEDHRMLGVAVRSLVLTERDRS
jgi:hypothetical protein